MAYDAIKKRLTALEAILTREEMTVSVELPDGTRAKRSASDWWDHRHDWKLSDFVHQSNRNGIVAFLVFAQLADDGIEKAKAAGDLSEVERLTEERAFMLRQYFGDDIP